MILNKSYRRKNRITIMKFEIGDVVDYLVLPVLYSDDKILCTGVVVAIDILPFGEQYYTVKCEGRKVYLFNNYMKLNISHRRKNIINGLI